MMGRLARLGLRKGVLGGSRGWTIVGVSAAAVAVLRRLIAQPPETVYRAVLKPGEGVEVRVLPPEVEERRQ